MTISKLITEKANPATYDIDLKSSYEIVELINDEDKKVAMAVEKELENIAKAVDLIVESFNSGGSLLYFGAGTSGRLGVLDASECPPTYGVEASMVRGYIAGGDIALRTAVEGAEDSFEKGEMDLLTSYKSSQDIVVGISASGRAPYVCGILDSAQKEELKTIAVSCNKEATMAKYADIHIAPEVGAEVITGSSRMKAGTAQKMVLNMLTTASMIRIGKTFHNYMIDVKPTNSKLVERATNIITEITGLESVKAKKYLEKSNFRVKTAIIMIEKGLSKEEAEQLLNKEGGILRKALL